MCEGCPYHRYPYKAQIPVMVDGVRPVKTFRNDDDVKKVIDLIIKETREVNETMGKSFDIANSVLKQLPFFSCINVAIDKDSQSDIAKYSYCSEFSIPPYIGGYGKQSNRWVAKSFIIKRALAARENSLKQEQMKNQGNK